MLINILTDVTLLTYFTVIHYTIVCKAAIRAAIGRDIAMWLVAIEMAILANSMGRVCELIQTTRSEMAQPIMAYRAVLPNRFEDPSDRGVWASEPAVALPAAVRPPTAAEESVFIAQMFIEINEKFRTDLGTDISVNKEIEEPAAVDVEEKPMLIVVGNSHAKKIYEKAAADGFPSTLLQLSDLDRSSITDCAGYCCEHGAQQHRARGGIRHVRAPDIQGPGWESCLARGRRHQASTRQCQAGRQPPDQRGGDHAGAAA